MRAGSRHTVIGAVSRALEHARVRSGSLILIALSGGADSVALFHALIELRSRFGLRLATAHLNHNLRGSESDRDEAFVCALSAGLGIEIVVERADGLYPGIANLEERARDARHDFLNRTADALGAEHIALAHHADDQAETVLMRLIRGAGIAGLGAMAAVGPGRIIRPMLAVTRREIREYLGNVGASFVADSSNDSTALLRNRIRRELLPMLEREYAPELGRRLVELGAEMRTTGDFIARVAARELAAMRRDDGALDLAGLATLDPALRAPAMRLYLAESLGSLRRLTRAHLDAVVRLSIAGPPNGQVALPGGWRAIREYSRLRVIPRDGAPAVRFETPIAFDASTMIPEVGYAFDAAVMPACDAAMPSNRMTAVFDLSDLAQGGLIARNFRHGDRIRPLGLDGTRKVKDVFIDAKIPAAERARFPLVASGADIVWMPGLVRSDRAPVSPASEIVVRLEVRQINAN